jgi:hypothetical protein
LFREWLGQVQVGHLTREGLLALHVRLASYSHEFAPGADLEAMRLAVDDALGVDPLLQVPDYPPGDGEAPAGTASGSGAALGPLPRPLDERKRDRPAHQPGAVALTGTGRCGTGPGTSRRLSEPSLLPIKSASHRC